MPPSCTGSTAFASGCSSSRTSVRTIWTSTATWSRTSRRSGASSSSSRVRSRSINVGDEYGRRLAEELPDAVTFTADDAERARRDRASAPRTLQRRECARSAPRRACARRRRRRDQARARVGARRAGALRVGRRRAAVPRDRRLRAQAGRARQRAPCRDRPCRREPRALRARCGRRPRPGQAARHGAARFGARRRDDRHLRQSSQRGSRGRSRRRSCPAPRVPSKSSSTATRLSAARSGSPGRATSSLIAGKGAEQGQEFADRTIPFDDREAAKEALKALEAKT